MSGIFDQIINYSPPLIVSGTVNYKGTWNASTNNPPLSNPPVASTKGDYYVVSTAGTQFSISFAVGDWIISSGTAWEKVDLTDAVSSVFGRTGAVVGVSTDYSAVGLTNTAIGASSPSTGAFTTVTASSTIAASGTVTGSNLSGTNTGDQTTISGNAGSATILQTARNINGVSFNGSADITVAAAAGTLTGNTLASGVTASSLTSVGTIASLVATTADINGGTIDGTTVGATAPSTGAFTTGSFSSTLFAGGVTTLRGANVPVANNSGFLIVGSSDAAAADLGGSIGFQANTTSLANYPMGNISARLIATGAGVYRSYMAFATTDAVGSVVERMRLTDTGLAVTGALSSTGTATFTKSANSAGSVAALLQNADGNSGIGARLAFRLDNLANEWSYINVNRVGGGATAQMDIAVNGAAFSGAPTVVASLSSTGLAVTGALSSTTGANFATSSGNVGIGTTSPARKLVVASSGAMKLSTAQGALFSDTANDGGVIIGSDFAIGSIQGTDAAGTSAKNLTLQAEGGNLGIGTTSFESGFKLHVAGNGFFSQASGTVGKVVVDNADQRLVLGAYFEGGVGQYSFISSTNNAETGDLDLVLRTGTTERARITSTGLAVTGALTCSTGFGCNGNAAQTKAVSGGTLAGVIAALVANGILSS